jgi:hypothetical protein
MAIYETFSKRQKRFSGDVPDVYQYDDIPKSVRIQVSYIIQDAINNKRKRDIDFLRTNNNMFQSIYDTLCCEYGQLSLSKIPTNNISDFQDFIIQFMLKNKKINQVFDVIELIFKKIINEFDEDISTIAIHELNSRFKENGIGYQFESGEIIRIDSQFIHSEAVRPVLSLLSDPRFQGANEEFLNAHEHYRHGRYKKCLNDCLKAFESTMKTIFDKQEWSYQSTDAASKLIKICVEKELIPKYLQSNLESGISTIRNERGGHGQGSQPSPVPQYFAAYQLHMTVSPILFLIEAEKALP